MKACNYCLECLERLAYQAAKLGANNKASEARAVKESLKILHDDFSLDCVSITIATKMHDVVKKITGNPDPYRQMKDKEIDIGRELVQQLEINGDDCVSCLKFSASGNTIDFFRPIELLVNDLKEPVQFVIDDSNKFEAKLGSSHRLLYLADNAGEVFFDLPLLKLLRKKASVAYVVKSSAVQNDITLSDIELLGLKEELGEVLTTGTATPGIDFSLASTEFEAAYNSADLIFAKGMGYYESLSELPASGKVFYCLRAKCPPVADSLKVPLNSYVAMLR